MSSDRKEMIKDYIDSHGQATVAELLALCSNYSAMTLWRDLKALEGVGAIRRIRGGAISMRSIQPGVEGFYSQRALENTTAKQAIARVAAKRFVPEGNSVFLDAGSTLMAVAKNLPNHHFTIITSGANIAIELSQHSFCNIICVGGQISANTLSFSGPQAESFLENVNIDTALMATSGYSAQSGFTSGSFTEHQFKRKVIEKASHVVMLMDLSKLDRSLPFTFAELSDINALICEAEPPESLRREAEQKGVELIVASAE